MDKEKQLSIVQFGLLLQTAIIDYEEYADKQGVIQKLIIDLQNLDQPQEESEGDLGGVVMNQKRSVTCLIPQEEIEELDIKSTMKMTMGAFHRLIEKKSNEHTRRLNELALDK